MNQYRDKFKEIDYANYLFETSDVKRSNLTYELGLIYRRLQQDGCDDNNINSILENVIINYKPDATSVFINSAINRVVKYNKNRPLYQVDSIFVTDKELEYVESQPIQKELKKVLFTLLCVLKIERKLYSIKKEKDVEDIKFKNIIIDNNGRVAELRKRTNIPSNFRFIGEILYNLYRDGYISYGSGDEFLVSCDFLDDIEDSDNVIYEMKNFQNIGLTYEKLTGKDRYINCKECGVLVKATSSTSTYCKVCSRERELEKKRRYINKVRR